MSGRGNLRRRRWSEQKDVRRWVDRILWVKSIIAMSDFGSKLDRD